MMSYCLNKDFCDERYGDYTALYERDIKYLKSTLIWAQSK